ncbi:MAG TPA: redoxin domain-containing protein [Methylomirabilota bacterium]|jgi:peroxiredoxin|nr:redoxin domain-containing protein [Methylomirabilota bacterium]
MTELRPPVAPGEPAPDFTLPAVDRPESVSLADYRGRNPLFLSLLSGLWCPFCRRTIAHMGAMESRLKEVGVQTLGVVATTPENARLYFKYRPTQLRLGSDPELSTHRAYGVGKLAPEHANALETTRINPFGDLPEPLPAMEVAMVIAKADGYAETPTDKADMERQWPQLKAQFLIDRAGIVRWANIEAAKEGAAGVGKFPSAEEVIAAAKALR